MLFKTYLVSVLLSLVCGKQLTKRTSNDDTLGDIPNVGDAKLSVDPFANKKGPGCNPTNPTAPFNVPLLNLGNAAWLTQITIGNPPQTLNLEFDTGSANLLVQSSSCQTADCQGTNKYNSASSSTFKQNGTAILVKTPAGSATGITDIDLVTIGDIQLQYPNFAELSHYDFGGSGTPALDGIFGAAYPDDATNGIQPPVYSMVQQCGLRNVFGVWLNEIGGPNAPVIKGARFTRSKGGPQRQISAKPTPVANGGQVTFGGVNKSLFSEPITWIPLVRAYWWQVSLDKVVSRDTVISPGNLTAVICTGTTDVGVPGAYVDQLNSAINAKEIGDTGYFSIDCAAATSGPNVDLYFAGQKFSLPPSAYVINYGNNECETAFYRHTFGHWTVGTTLLKQYYSIWDGEKNRVGLAKLSSQAH